MRDREDHLTLVSEEFHWWNPDCSYIQVHPSWHLSRYGSSLHSAWRRWEECLEFHSDEDKTGQMDRWWDLSLSRLQQQPWEPILEEQERSKKKDRDQGLRYHVKCSSCKLHDDGDSGSKKEREENFNLYWWIKNLNVTAWRRVYIDTFSYEQENRTQLTVTNKTEKKKRWTT